MNKMLPSLIVALVTILTIPCGYGAENYINFPDNKDYPGLYQIPEYVWGGKSHEKLRDFYNKYMNKEGYTDGYLYNIALPNGGIGKVILMIGMGKEEENCDYMLSTSEAMGYGMIMSVILGDKETFDGLLKTVKHYHAYNPATDNLNPRLTSWCIPGLKGSLPENYKVNLPLSDKRIDVKSPRQTLQGAPADKSQCKSSATDGEQDIAYALLMAHWQWEAHIKDSKNNERFSYLNEAIERYQEISNQIMVEKEEAGGRKKMFLRIGDHFGELDRSKENLTRPCDWALTHYRAAFELTGDERFNKLIQSIFSYINDDRHPISHRPLVPDFGWWDEELGTLRVASDNATENPEHISSPQGDTASGYFWNDVRVQKWKPAGVISNAFHWNACRYPWRMTLDAIHYQDQRSIDAGRNIALKLYNAFGKIQKKSGTEIAHDYHQLPMGSPLSATGYLKEWEKNNPEENDPEKIRYSQVDAIWTSTAFTAPYLIAYALVDPVERASEYVKSVNRCLNGFVGITPEWCEADWETDPFTNSNDPYYSGYYEDSINLLSMLTLAGDWWKPHLRKNKFTNSEFNEGTNGWKVIAKNGFEVDVKIETKMNNPVLHIKINKVPTNYNSFDLVLIQGGIQLQEKENYTLSMNAYKNWSDRPNNIALKVAPCSDETTSVTYLDSMTMDQKFNAYYTARILGNTTDQSPCRFGETTISLGFAHNLHPGDELWIDNLSLH